MKQRLFRILERSRPSGPLARVVWLAVVAVAVAVACLLVGRVEAACNADDGTQFELDVDWVKGKRSNCGEVCTGTASCDGAYKSVPPGYAAGPLDFEPLFAPLAVGVTAYFAAHAEVVTNDTECELDVDVEVVCTPYDTKDSTGNEEDEKTKEPVNTLNGNVFFSETDISIPCPGMPLAFRRTYNSVDKQDGPLGAGWTHSYNWGVSRTREVVAHVIPEVDTTGYKIVFCDGSSVTVTTTGGVYLAALNLEGNVSASKSGNVGMGLVVTDGDYEIDLPTCTPVFVTLVYPVGGGGSCDPEASEGGGGEDSYVPSPVFGAVQQNCIAVDRWYMTTSHSNCGPPPPPPDPPPWLCVGQILDIVTEEELSYTTVHTTNEWVTLRAGDGKQYRFEPAGDGTYESRINNWQIQSTSNNYHLLLPGGVTYVFDAGGKLDLITNEWGNSVTLTYESGATLPRLTSISNSIGQVLTLSHDGDDHITGINVSATTNLSMSFSYDAGEQLESATRHTSNPDTTWTYAYTNRFLSQRVNPRGDMFAYTYVPDGLGRPTSRGASVAVNGTLYKHTLSYENLVSNFVTTVSYDLRQTNQTYAYKYAWTNGSKLLAEIEGPNGTDLGRSFVYDADRNKTQDRVYDDGTGEYELLTMGHDDNHNVTNLGIGYGTAPASTWQIDWHEEYQTPTSVTDPLGRRMTALYANGSPSSFRLYHDATSFYETKLNYTGDGLLSSIVNANGHTTSVHYDGYGYPTSVVPEVGPVLGLAFDTLGHLTGVTLPGADGPRNIALDVDELGHVKEIEYPDGLSETFAYDSIGNLTNWVDTVGRVTRYGYEATRKLTSIVREMSDGAAVTNSLDYDELFNVLTVRDALNREAETYVLDDQDRAVAATNLEGQSMSVTYDLGRYLSSVTRSDGTTVQADYDSAGLLSELAYPGCTNTYVYLSNGLLETAANESGTISNSYNGANRLVASSCAAPNSAVDYAYLPAGQVSDVTSAAGDLTYGYDAAERVSEIAAPSGEFVFTYDAHNGLAGCVSNEQSGISVRYGYSEMDQVTNITWFGPSNEVLRSFGYGYDDARMITNVLRESGQRSAYAYDSLDRLIAATLYASGGGVSNETSLEYDLVDNRTIMAENGVTNTYTLGGGNRLASWGTDGESTVAHDAAGNVTNASYGDGRSLALSWNGRYQLTEVRTNGVAAETYQYDALGRRISAVTDGVTNHFVHDGIHVIAEVDGDGNLLRSYTWGPGIDNLLAFTDYTEGETNTYYALTDHLGTVHALADETGEIVESYRFDAWGRVLGVHDSNGMPLPESAIGNHYLWQGRCYSWNTGLYCFRARWYDPITGRWLSKDPIGISGGLNQYVSFENNPVNFRDPWGLDPDDGSFETIPVVIAGPAIPAKNIFEFVTPLAKPISLTRVSTIGILIWMLRWEGDIPRDYYKSQDPRDYEDAKRKLKSPRKNPPWADKPQPPRDSVRPKPHIPPVGSQDWPPDSGGPQN